MSEPCRACHHFPAPSERGIHLCDGCTRLLKRYLDHPEQSTARILDRVDYGQACEICEEYRDRRMVLHPEWGRICEVDVREAWEFHGEAAGR